MVNPEISAPESGHAPAMKAQPPSAYKYKFRDEKFLTDYHGTKVFYPFYETLPDVEKFQAHPEDICIVTFPKCGTTFMSAVVQMIMHDADPASLSTGPPLEQKISYLEMCFPNMPVGVRPVDRISRSPAPRAYFTHLGYDALPATIREKAKLIYVARNPKDTIVSMHNFIRATPSMDFHGSLEETAESFFNNTCIYAPFYDHVADFWKRRDELSNCFFTSFEGLLKDFKSVVRELAKFLGKELSDEQLDVIAYHCNFDSMKQNNNCNRTGVAKMGHWDFSISPFMRAGKAGNWKEHFSPELNQRVEKWISTEEERLKNELKGFSFEYE